MSLSPSVSPVATASTRRYDLDWLRIIAFILLIFYHIGMYFNTEGWHAKSLHANDAMEPLMWLSSPWRLPLLFFISGVAIRYLGDKLGAGRFALDRTWRLLPVILFGMFVIVAPQTWSELRIAGEIGPGFWDFYRQYAGQWEGPWSVFTPTWNHLWYVAYLFVYCLLLAPLIPLLRAGSDSRLMQTLGRWASANWIGSLGLLILPLAPFLLYRFTLVPMFPTTHDLTGDWANHAGSLTILLYGYAFARNDGLWKAVDRAFPLVAVVTVTLFVLLYAAYTDFDWVAERAYLLWPARVARIVFAWSIILTLLGAARRWLNTDGPVRRYLTQAVFPYYILHQTITVSAGYALRQAGLDVWTEFFILVAVTGGGCVLGFEIVRRIPLLRPVMGLKWSPDPVRPVASRPAAAA